MSCLISDGTYHQVISWRISRYVAVNGPPVIVSFAPQELFPTMIIDTELEFGIRAIDPDDDDLVYFVTVDDTVRSNISDYIFVATVTGERRIRAEASDGEHRVFQEWLVTVTEVPDTIAPATVVLTLLDRGTEPGFVELEWLAVGKDGTAGIASEYLIHSSPAPILTEANWDASSQRPGAPAPVASGQPMSMMITDLSPGVLTYIAVRAVDDFGNLSPLGASTGTFTRGMRFTGTVRDAVTAAPIAGATLRIGPRKEIADESGAFVFAEMPSITGRVNVTEDDDNAILGTHRDYDAAYTVVHNDVLDLFLFPNLSLTTPFYPSFYLFFRALTDTRGIPPETEQRRWELPIDLYVPGFVHNGLDYRQTIQDAASSLDAVIGRQVFNFVDTPPEIGVTIRYRDDIMFDNFGVDEWSADWYPLQATIEHRTGYSSTTQIELTKVSLHELGHSLGLNHSVDSNHIMVGGQSPAVPFFSLEEQAVLQAHYNIPRGMDTRSFISN